MAVNKRKVRTYLSNIAANLNATDRRIVEYVLGDPATAVQLPVKSLAEQLRVSEATVVRFCKRIGYAGLLDFRNALQSELLDEADYTLPSSPEILLNDSKSNVAQKIVMLVERALKETVDLLDMRKIRAVVDLLVNANRVIFVGFGASGLSAMEARDKMNRIGIDSDAFVDRFAMTLKLANLKPSDLVVAFSYSGETPEVVNAFRLAEKARAKRLAITHRSQSPLTDLCEHFLLTCGEVQDYAGDSIGTRASQLFIIEFLCNEITKHNYKNYHSQGIPINELLLKERVKSF